MEEMLKKIVEEFNKKAENKKLKNKISELDRKIVIEIIDDKTYHMHLCNGKISNFGVGEIDSDIKIIFDSITLRKLINKEMSPIKAYATKKLKIKASITDLLKIKSLF